MLREHGEMGREFPDVLANTTSAFGLGDWEWILAFEADDLDADRHEGWTVTAVGHLSVVPAEEALVLAPAEPGRQLIRLGVESVSGHRLLV